MRGVLSAIVLLAAATAGAFAYAATIPLLRGSHQDTPRSTLIVAVAIIYLVGWLLAVFATFIAGSRDGWPRYTVAALFIPCAFFPYATVLGSSGYVVNITAVVAAACVGVFRRGHANIA